MLFRTHLVFGLAVYFVLSFLLEFENMALFLAFVLIGAVFVDIDSKKSRAGNNLLLRPLQLFVRHRGSFHSLLFGVLISLAVAFFSRVAGIGFFAGYLSHLFLDSLTPAGVRIFWPLSRKKFGFGIRSGGMFEDVVFVLLLLFDVFMVGRWVFNYLF